MCETLNDEALDKIFAGLSDDDNDVRAQVLKTMSVLATKGLRFVRVPTAFDNVYRTIPQQDKGCYSGYTTSVGRLGMDGRRPELYRPAASPRHFYCICQLRFA